MTSSEISKVWFITGTSSGFGRQLVHSALSRGDYVIATARSLDKIQDLPKSENIRLLQLDVDTGAVAIKIKVQEALTFWGRIDVLVNNAGTGEKALIEEGGSELFRRQFQTNVFGLIDVTTGVLPHMRERRSGTIVMMGSRSSWKPENPSTALYSASKAAVRTFSETLAVELSEFSIRVLIVEPAAFRTGILASRPFYRSNPISDYDALRKRSIDLYEAARGRQKGDPAKGMEVLTDVVRGEGKARGRPWPLYLMLGIEAEKSVKEKCEKVTGVMEAWRDMTGDLDFDPL